MTSPATPVIPAPPSSVRQPHHRRNPALESALQQLNGLLATAAPPGCDPATTRGLAIVGPPRSGTTLLLQELARSGRVSWVSNLAARCWARPAVGLQLQGLLADERLQFRDELADLHGALEPIATTSRLGKTTGALSPSEAWHWWRHHLGDDLGDVAAPAPSPAAWQAFARSAAEVAQVGDRAIAMKAMIAWAHLDALADAMPRLVLVRVRRPLADVVDSVLRARVEHTGSAAGWWSFRTHARAIGTPRAQVEAQVATIDGAVDEVARSRPARVHEVGFERLVASPDDVVDELLGVVGD